MLFTRAVLINLCLLSSAYAKEDSSDAITWLEAERSVLVHLPTPDLFYWNARDQYATQYPGAFIFNFTLTHDGRTLLVNDEPFLPRVHPYVPTRLRAFQIPWTAKYYKDLMTNYGTNLTGRPKMDLDYYISLSPDTGSRTSIYNTKYKPRLRLDILRANIHDGPGYSVPLSSDRQQEIWIQLEDLSEVPPGTPYSDISLKIGGANIAQRWGWEVQDGFGYKAPKSLKTCHIWSWLCPDRDNDESTHFEYVYQENFDQFGKKGSMRHFLTRRWANLVGLLGLGRAIVLLAVCASMVLSPFVYAISRGVKTVLHTYLSRIQEVDDWNADEEIDGILMHDRYFEDFKATKIEDDDVKEGEKTCIEPSSGSRLDSSVKTKKSLGL
ncbi:hypothetical protein VTL71DRAFT_1018 [Oculimacula yallundae]|uniref:Uncharacterized protein n=1 Tax=Oculimacula yallundae TaxID=86028 RepID=A0ABR4D1N7_9HELO